MELHKECPMFICKDLVSIIGQWLMEPCIMETIVLEEQKENSKEENNKCT
jgi:hypothetical protein